MIYWDTSCVLKLYVAESDSEQWERHAVTLNERFACSALLEAEIACALHNKESRGELISGGADALIAAFHEDRGAGRFALFPVGEDVLKQAGVIAATCNRNPQPIQLRTLDAIHLATAILLKCKRIATADQRMLAAADRLGLTAL